MEIFGENGARLLAQFIAGRVHFAQCAGKKGRDSFCEIFIAGRA